MADSPPIDIAFFKMEGCGNDYVYLDLDLFQAGHREFIDANARTLARRMADRHFGVGGDGLVLVQREGEECGRMTMFNADGSESAICGNALRCVAKYLAEAADEEVETIDIHTGSGIKRTELRWSEGEVIEVRADMGTPLFATQEIPLDPDSLPPGASIVGGGGDGPLQLQLRIGEETLPAYALSMGNPHLVVFVDRDPIDYDLDALAAPLESAPMFPARANIEFVQDLGERRVRQRTFERGTGETLACGSGASAGGVAAVTHGLLARGEFLEVELLGGNLQIEWSEKGPVFMTGPAHHVFEGIYHYA